MEIASMAHDEKLSFGRTFGTVTRHGSTDDANRRPAELKRPCPDTLALLREASGSCDSGTGAGESCDSNQNTKSEFAAGGLRLVRSSDSNIRGGWSR